MNKMASATNMTAASNRVTKNPQRQRNQVLGSLAGMSTSEIKAKHQEVSNKFRDQFKKQAEIAVSIVTVYLNKIKDDKMTSMMLFERKFIFELLDCLRT